MADYLPSAATQPVRAKASDRADAFRERFSQARVDRAYRFAAAVLGSSSADAQDAVQDAAIRAWSHWADLSDVQAFDAWFDRILVNVCRDRLRANRRLSEIRAEATGVPILSARAPLGILSDSFDRLKSDQKIVIALRYVEDLSLDEIARRTGVKLGTVKSRLHYALQSLRADYDASRRAEY